MLHSLLRFERLFNASTCVDSPRARGGFVYVSFGVRTCREHCAAEGPGSVATRVLYQQDFG